MTEDIFERSGVVSTDDFNKWEWRESPLLSNIIVSEHGHVAERTGITEWTYVIPTDAQGWLSDYYKTRVYLANGNVYIQLLHVIVALVYYGEVPNWKTLKVVVNHKDGNKRNNHYTNLEWCSRSENQIHAYNTGLRTDGCGVTVTDHLDGSTVVYPTLAAMARTFGISKTESSNFCHKYRKTKYLNRYTFERKNNNKTLKKSWVKTIYAFDYNTNTLHVADDSAKMEYVTGIGRNTILYNLRDSKHGLINGWAFSYNSTDFKPVTEEQLEQSITRWARKKVPNEKIFGVQVKDYLTNEIFVYSSNKEASTAHNQTRSMVAYICQQTTPKLIKAKSFRYPSDKPWPSYDTRLIKASSKYRKECKNVFEIKDLIDNTTEWYPTIHSFSIEHGLNPVIVAGWYREKGTKPYKNRYIITNITESLTSSPI